MKLSFQRVFQNAYVVYLDEERIGFISIKGNNLLENLDMNPLMVDAIKDEVMNSLLFELDRDEIMVICSPEMSSYYEDFGFQQIKKGMLRYSLCLSKKSSIKDEI